MSKEKTKLQEPTIPPLLIADVNISVCEHNNLIIKKKTVKCPHCGKIWKVV